MPQPATKQITDESLDQLDNSPYTGTKGISLESILEYRKKGLTYSQIGKLTGCTKQNISVRLKSISHEVDALEAFKSNRADLITLTSRRILNLLTPAKLKEASAYQLTGMLGILYDKERLERGQATQITDYRGLNLTGTIDELRAAMRAEHATIDI